MATLIARLRKALTLGLVVLAALAVTADEAFATHFRYGSMTWQRVAHNVAGQVKVRLRFDFAGRWSFPYAQVPAAVANTCPPPPFVATGTAGNGACPAIGKVLNIGGLVTDKPVSVNGGAFTTSIPTAITVTSINQADDSFTGTMEADLVYLVASDPVVVTFSAAARLSTLLEGNADQIFTVTTRIDADPFNGPPTAGTLPIITLARNMQSTFRIPASDPDGDPITFAVSSTAMSGLARTIPGTSTAPVFDDLTLSPAGDVTWRPVTSGLYAFQAQVSDSRGAYTVVDMLLRVVDAVGNVPNVLINGSALPQTLTTVHSVPVTFTVQGVDPEGTPVLLGSGALPLGSSLTPSLPTTVTAPAYTPSTFNWTPGPGDVGTYVIVFSALDGAGLQRSNSMTLTVSNDPPVLACAASGGTVEATGPGGGAFSLSADVSDPNGDLLTVRFFVDGVQRSVSGLLTSPNSHNHSATYGLGDHTWEGRVSDGQSTVSCGGTFSVVDTTAPAIGVLDDVEILGTSAAGAVHTFVVPSANDAVDPAPVVVCVPPSGSTFPYGATPVTCTATDASGNAISSVFTVNVSKAVTSLQALTVDAQVFVGDVLRASTVLNRTSAPAGPVAGATVVFQLTAPGGGVTTVAGLTDGLGRALVSFPLAERGSHTVTASFAGTATLQPTSTASVPVGVFQKTGLFVNTAFGTAGAATAIVAQLAALPDGTPIANQPVSFDFGNIVAAQTAVTGVDGMATVLTTYANAGDYIVQAAFSDLAAYFVDPNGLPIPTTATAQISIASAATDLALTSSQNPSDAGDAVTFTAVLTRSQMPAGPIAGAPVVFRAGPVVRVSSTDAAGVASVTIDALPVGAHSVVAEFAGTGGLNPATDSLNQVVLSQPETFFVDSLANDAASPNLTIPAAKYQKIPAGLERINNGTGGGDAASNNDRPMVSTRFRNYLSEPQFTATLTMTLASPDLAYFGFGRSEPDPNYFNEPTPSFVFRVHRDWDGYSGIQAWPTTFGSSVNNPDHFFGYPGSPLEATYSGPVTLLIRKNGDTLTMSIPAMGVSRTISISAYAGAMGLDATNSRIFFGSTNNTTVFSDLRILRDSTPPVITAGNVGAEATGPEGAVVGFAPTAEDDVDGPVAVSTVPASGSVFPLGVTTVTATATDAAGNESQVTFAVTVSDTTPPVLIVPDDQTLEATGPNGAVATYAGALASDIVDGAVAASCQPASGSTFALGVNTVTCTATDAAGNTASASFTVTVLDTTPPAVVVPDSQTLEATGPNGAVATYAGALASDTVDGVVAASCAPASGSMFALGVTTVTCTATDAAGNTASASFTVTVRDTTPPALTVPANQAVEATGPAGAAVTYAAATATDVVDPAPVVTCLPASGSVFPLGGSTVTCTATDAQGNAASASFTVDVRDTTAPVVTVPANLTVEAAGPAGATVTYAAATATDVVDPAPALVCLPASGSTFALGVTTVTCTATDASGNVAGGSFTVRVGDTTAPVLTVPASQTLEAASGAGAVATFAASATDAVGPVSITYSQNPGTTFALGTTTVTVTATDGAGNATTGTFTITVRDTTAPAIASVTPSQGTLWPPNHQMVAITVRPVATDAVGVVSQRIIGVTSSEPDNGLGDGDTAGDVVITGPLTVNLRAERSGKGNGRTYTITVEVRDAVGNVSTKTCTVVVPKSQGR